ncbi:hypothetical protein CKW39_08955 [Kocuria sp. WRN011]|uniref:Gp19/Gp15/Gp42 family protein n=1 Tax=Kocuria TaxID=57493 RepID=UPI000BAFA8F3|nr:Gp19/Gp15/Gp42 family protein [Kocuria sp. WRN011]PBB08478.1 hypothetical protein CKW39_08955 [Kocuria sp. WRN011]
MNSYGTTTGLEGIWRPLTDQERVAAENLLTVVSAIFRARVPDLDARLDSGQVDRTLVDFAAQQVVKRVLMNPEGFKQITESTGPTSGSYTLDQSIAGVNLYVSDGDLKLFLPSYGATFNIGTIRVRPGLGMG